MGAVFSKFLQSEQFPAICLTLGKKQRRSGKHGTPKVRIPKRF